MKTLDVDTIEDVAQHLGETFGPSAWLTIDQTMIDAFASVTNDLGWYHIDPVRAAREMPGGRTIAHGLLISSLVPGLTAQFVKIRGYRRGLNYGSDKVRYIAPVYAGDAVRLSMTMASLTPAKGGLMLRGNCVMELEGSIKPAMTAEILSLIFTQ